MNWSKLSKEKRKQLILVCLLTVLSVAALGLGLIKFQYASLARLAQEKLAAEKKDQEMADAVKHADRTEAELAETGTTLSGLEADMASGDLYSWVINTVRRAKLGSKVEIPQFSQISGVMDMNLLPSFPYKQASLTVVGTGYYHDFGKFLADLENGYPHIRVLNLSLESSAGSTTGDAEKLSFKMDLVTLVKPNPS